jgi:hypothetical protein
VVEGDGHDETLRRTNERRKNDANELITHSQRFQAVAKPRAMGCRNERLPFEPMWLDALVTGPPCPDQLVQCRGISSGTVSPPPRDLLRRPAVCEAGPASEGGLPARHIGPVRDAQRTEIRRGDYFSRNEVCFPALR